ncbi:MAG: hypothetical protein U0929_18055 [Planctomycetaceae bacterium]
MPYTLPSDQPGPEEIRWGELLRTVDEFHEKTIAIADDFAQMVPRLREHGTPLTTTWKRQYIDWNDRRNQIATEVASRLGVPSVNEKSFAEWKEAIEQKRDELRAIRERDAEAVRSVVNVIQRVQGLSSTDTALNNSAEVTQARTLATVLLERLGDPATRAVVLEDAVTMKGMCSLLLLVDGTSDQDAEEQAVADVDAMFGRKLSIALLRGRITAQAVPVEAQPDQTTPPNETLAAG